MSEAFKNNKALISNKMSNYNSAFKREWKLDHKILNFYIIKAWSWVADLWTDWLYAASEHLWDVHQERQRLQNSNHSNLHI